MNSDVLSVFEGLSRGEAQKLYELIMPTLWELRRVVKDEPNVKELILHIKNSNKEKKENEQNERH